EKSVGCIFSLHSRLSNFGLVGKLAFGGRCFLDSNSWALKILRVASFKFSAFLSRMTQSLSSSFRFSTLKLNISKFKFIS
ncbi:hypothetical protein F7U73_22630, partial [Vibrio vulnificus]|nr:hypothetical protein [Vibrio vulnificus]